MGRGPSADAAAGRALPCPATATAASCPPAAFSALHRACRSRRLLRRARMMQDRPPPHCTTRLPPPRRPRPAPGIALGIGGDGGDRLYEEAWQGGAGSPTRAPRRLFACLQDGKTLARCSWAARRGAAKARPGGSAGMRCLPSVWDDAAPEGGGDPDVACPPAQGIRRACGAAAGLGGRGGAGRAVWPRLTTYRIWYEVSSSSCRRALWRVVGCRARTRPVTGRMPSGRILSGGGEESDLMPRARAASPSQIYYTSSERLE